MVLYVHPLTDYRWYADLYNIETRAHGGSASDADSNEVGVILDDCHTSTGHHHAPKDTIHKNHI